MWQAIRKAFGLPPHNDHDKLKQAVQAEKQASRKLDEVLADTKAREDAALRAVRGVLASVHRGHRHAKEQ